MRKILILIAIFCAMLLACGSIQELVAGEGGNVISVAADDPEMNAAIQEAQDTLPLFIAALQAPTATQSYFSIKVGFPYGEAGEVEHMWVSKLSYTDGQFAGILDNKPVFVTDIHLGDQVAARLEEISDWMIVDDGRLLGGFTLHVLRNQMNADEREQYDAEMGIVIPESPALP
jgi:uncharacterized protein YegJ (DUF2314 family)